MTSCDQWLNKKHDLCFYVSSCPIVVNIWSSSTFFVLSDTKLHLTFHQLGGRRWCLDFTFLCDLLTQVNFLFRREEVFRLNLFNSALFMEDLLRTWIRFSVPCRVVSASQETKRSCRLNETTAGRRRTVVWVNSWFSCSQTSRLWIITTSLNVKTYCTVWLFKGKKKSVTEELISWIRNGFTLVTTGCIWGGVHSLDLLYVKVSGNRLFSDTF